MSNAPENDPFATPAPAAATPVTPQWQGTPVPPPAAHIPPPPAQYHPGYAVAAYPPPPPTGYMYAPGPGAVATSKNWMGITSLILSLGTLLFGITFIPGLVLGHLGLSAVKKGEANNYGVALAGVIIGWFFVAVTLLFIGVIVAAMAATSSYS